MYDNHVPVICSAVRADPDIFARGITFAVLSIQQMIITVPDAMRDVDANGDASRYLFGSKRGAYRYIQEHKAKLWAEVCATEDTAEAIHILTRIPGLGIVKAAFVLQFIGHDIACLDTRNIQRENRDPNEFQLHGRKHGAFFQRKVERYLREAGGRARELWDAWCDDVATTYKTTAEAISKLHQDVIVPKTYTGVRTCVVPMIRVAEDIPF